MAKKIISLLITALLLQGCGAILVGGAATTASVIHDRRSAGTIVDDNALELKIKTLIEKSPLLAGNSHINVTGYNGLILLTGEAFNDDIRKKIVALTEAVPGVSRVENQIIIGRRSTFMERAYDSKQTAKAKAALFEVNLPGFDPTRVKIVTEHARTYLMGIVSQQEAIAVVDVIRHVSGVKEVISLFEITGNSFNTY